VWSGYDLTANTGGGIVTGSPATIIEPNGSLDVMAVGTNGHQYQFNRDPSTFVWSGYDLTANTGGGDTVSPGGGSAGGGGPTAAETAAVDWAVGQIGGTSYGNLCLTFVYDAYQNGTGINLRNDTSGVSYNANTDPQDVWGHTATGTTGAAQPPYGALVFFNAKSGYDPECYSHVAIMGANGEMISTNDAFNEHAVHYETLAQEQGSGSYSTYAGWWLPDA
jgi:cell wall-associated NlpC family hydrolase